MADKKTTILKDLIEQGKAKGKLSTKEINDALNELHAAHLAIRDLADEQEKANKYAHEIVPMMERLRAGVDAREIVVAHDLWPVPTYNDILFYC